MKCRRSVCENADVSLATELPMLLGAKEMEGKQPAKLPDETSPMDRDDFDVIEMLGRGAFGEVKLVECKRNGVFYAMKTVEKALLHERRHVGDQHAMQRAKVERDIGVAARQWSCPFIVEMFAAFQSSEKLYYVFEYCPGGELLELLKAQPGAIFDEPAARFYIAEISLALAHLHDHDVIHRDVKLENVLIARDSHVRLTDFGCAKHSLAKGGTGSFVDVASPLVFMPPEVRRGELHGKDIDCWQLGVATFAMLAGSYPSPGSVAGATGCELPSEISEAARQLCYGMLSQDRSERLGYPTGAGMLRAHDFFEGLDWDAVEAKTCPPPFGSEDADADATPMCRGVMCRKTEPTWSKDDVLKVSGFAFSDGAAPCA